MHLDFWKSEPADKMTAVCESKLRLSGSDLAELTVTDL